MTEIPGIDNQAAGKLVPPERAKHGPPVKPDSARQEQAAQDRVELSEAAATHDPQVDAARMLEARINDIKARIASDTYVTEDKLDVVVERLHDKIFGS